jgi:hypothetical protein
MKKVYLFFTVVLLLSMASAWAQGGTTGPLTWEINNGTLTISGEGEMPDYGKFGAPWFAWYSYGTPIHSVVIDFGVTSIGNCAFFLVETLTEIKIPNSVARIGDNAFYGCKNMTSIVLPNDLKNIESAAFSDCISLTSIDLPNSISNLGGGVFWNCSSLTSITIPNNVTQIRIGSFAHCENLVSVNIPNGVINIENSAFLKCSNLTSIVFPNSVDSIGIAAFADCTSLTSIVIPNSVKSIDIGAFADCTSLTSVTNYNPVPIEINPGVFENVNQSNCTLKVPANAISAYQNAEVWKEFNIVDLEESINTIESSNIKIYPNPTTGELFVTSDELHVTNMEVFDIICKKQSHVLRVMGNENIINIAHMPAGIYFVKITTEAGKIVKKIIKK